MGLNVDHDQDDYYHDFYHCHDNDDSDVHDDHVYNHHDDYDDHDDKRVSYENGIWQWGWILFSQHISPFPWPNNPLSMMMTIMIMMIILKSDGPIYKSVCFFECAQSRNVPVCKLEGACCHFFHQPVITRNYKPDVSISISERY